MNASTTIAVPADTARESVKAMLREQPGRKSNLRLHCLPSVDSASSASRRDSK